MTKIYQNMEGVEFVVDMNTDLTTAVNMKLKVLKPDATTAIWNCVLSGTRAMKYISVAGDLDKVGVYKVQPYAEIGLFKGTGDTINVEVFAPYS